MTLTLYTKHISPSQFVTARHYRQFSVPRLPGRVTRPHWYRSFASLYLGTQLTRRAFSTVVFDVSAAFLEHAASGIATWRRTDEEMKPDSRLQSKAAFGVANEDGFGTTNEHLDLLTEEATQASTRENLGVTVTDSATVTRVSSTDTLGTGGDADHLVSGHWRRHYYSGNLLASGNGRRRQLVDELPVLGQYERRDVVRQFKTLGVAVTVCQLI